MISSQKIKIYKEGSYKLPSYYIKFISSEDEQFLFPPHCPLDLPAEEYLPFVLLVFLR